VPEVNRVSAALRQAGGLVVYLQHTCDAEAVRGWTVYFDHFCSPERRARMIETFSLDAPGHALWDGLDVRPPDLKVRKRRFGAFAPGASDLHEILQARGIDTLIITGTATQVCCESTARDAMMRNFRTIMVTDANAAMTDEMHNASLIAFYVRFGDIMSTNHLIDVLSRNSAQSAAAE
jgi:ureidoacrylate peracid hydrolase